MIDGYNTDSPVIAGLCNEFGLNNGDLFLIGIVGMAMISGNGYGDYPSPDEMVARYGRNKQARLAGEVSLQPASDIEEA